MCNFGLILNEFCLIMKVDRNKWEGRELATTTTSKGGNQVIKITYGWLEEEVSWQLDQVTDNPLNIPTRGTAITETQARNEAERAKTLIENSLK